MDETVAILFTDLEGSSRLWEQHPDRMPALLARHDRLTHDAVERQHGVIVKTTGDRLLAAFDDGAAAIRAAIEIQRALADPAFSEDIGGRDLPPAGRHCCAASRATTTSRRCTSKRADRWRRKSASTAARPAGCSSSRSPFSDSAIGPRPVNAVRRRSRWRAARATGCSSPARSAIWARRIAFAGEVEEAQSLFRESVALGIELHNRNLVAMNRLSLAMVALCRGALDEAVAMVSDAAVIADELASHTVGQTILDVVAALAAFCEDWPLAARFFGASPDHLGRTGLRRDPVDSAFVAPFVSRARLALHDEGFAAAERAGRELGYEQAMASARAWLEQRFGRPAA
jgi:hypothetical protein